MGACCSQTDEKHEKNYRIEESKPKVQTEVKSPDIESKITANSSNPGGSSATLNTTQEKRKSGNVDFKKKKDNPKKGAATKASGARKVQAVTGKVNKRKKFDDM